MPEATTRRFLLALTLVMAALFCVPQTAPGKALDPSQFAQSELWEPQPERVRVELVRIPGRHLADFAIVTENASGRTKWLSRDPLGEAGGLNLYGFLGNDPVNKWDYLGLSGFSAIEVQRAYVRMFGSDDPLYDAFWKAGHEFKTADVGGDNISTRQIWFTANHRLRVEEDMDSVQEAALLMRAGMLEILGKDLETKKIFIDLVDAQVDEADLVGAYRIIDEQAGAARKRIAKAIESGASAAELIARIANEPLDMIASAGEVADGNVTALAGMFPLIPGAAGKVVRKLPNWTDNLKYVEIGSTDLSKFSLAYRARNGISPGKNVFVVNYVSDGKAYTKAFHSSRRGHSEVWALGALPKDAKVVRAYSDRTPCTSGSNCFGQLIDDPRFGVWKRWSGSALGVQRMRKLESQKRSSDILIDESKIVPHIR